MTNKKSFLLSNADKRIGEKLGISPWVSIDQVQVNVFGEVTRWRTPVTVILNMRRKLHMGVPFCMAFMR